MFQLEQNSRTRKELGQMFPTEFARGKTNIRGLAQLSSASVLGALTMPVLPNWMIFCPPVRTEIKNRFPVINM